MSAVIKGVAHTTASTPRPHIVYTFQLERDGKTEVVKKRFSEFVQLHHALGVKDIDLPPKRILVTSFIPSAWVDDALIAERKKGLKTFLNTLLANPAYKDQAALKEFLTPALRASPRQFDLEDALPSTLSRKAAQELAPVVAATTFIAAAYYPDWSADAFPPENLNYSKFDILFFAFAIPNSSSTLTWDSGSQAILKRLVSSAKASGAGTKIVLSVGGWGGSTYFHQACSSSANRSTFVSALSSAVSTYGLDGIDIDWEYPNNPGAGNPYGSADAANLLQLLTSLRSALGSSKIISAAVTDLPWLGSDGNPIKDMSAYAAQMSYANLMNYDIFGDWSPAPGPNAPLSDACGTSSQPNYSAQAAFTQWTAAKFPANKLLLGLPLYGYVLNSSKTVLTGSFVEPEEFSTSATVKVNPMRGANRRPVTVRPPIISEVKADATANLQSWWGQQIPFSSLVSSGALTKSSNGTYSGANGFTEGWDDCSDTPYLFNTSQKTVVSYDDTYSLADKAALAKSNGMAGCFTWSLDQDDGVTLQNVIRKALGK
ncbi:Glycoside hydrolase family 18 protein [Mycena indigotica]|uniref:Glycoside hydrolase family 18 protein n=1 Tax=Mycena indigotica TaxID=2126181 RepID=A0A8H6TAA5_9AGAR|nr:Glycoside hydrolase family 18 protein [Mycena indigotica]KAF7315065.1 Glycoside hydrolase family 18 protein [Mycena indigotica]